ncbi:hypothetical protein ACFO25_00530 [Paenactinomyces guangxiensis]|uniref:YunG family protein n=1 Tax=Paenactinomyces guangxiensis TaxID=1490290 RepID=UPI001E46004F|nr:hypothetical protein [Paenactinomyces guangxiensis]
MLTHEKLLRILCHVWSEKSSTKYSPENPARGQCGVTALVVNDLFGGEILKTPLPEGWHFYNRIHGQVYDFTASQFKEEIKYEDILSSRDEAFADTNEQQYHYLKHSIISRVRDSD